MAVIIRKPGNPPKTREHRCTCPSCQCVFTFQQNDIRTVTQYNDTTRYIVCPQEGCGLVIHNLQGVTE